MKYIYVLKIEETGEVIGYSEHRKPLIEAIEKFENIGLTDIHTYKIYKVYEIKGGDTNAQN